MNKLNKPIQYYALWFFVQWEGHERELHERMSTDFISPESVHAAVSYFQVAGNFAGIDHDGSVARKLAATVEQIPSDPHQSPAQQVEELAGQLQEHFSHHGVSTASKLLWLRYRSPYVIHDPRTVRALRDLGYVFDDRDYVEYYACWQTQFAEWETAMREATDCLPQVQALFPNRDSSDIDFASLCKQRWFLERVFDLCLRESVGRESAPGAAGAPGRAP